MEQTPGRSNPSSSSHPSSKPSTSQQQQQQPTDIPEGLYDLLKGVTVAVLRDRPSDLYSFVADYFTKVTHSPHVSFDPSDLYLEFHSKTIYTIYLHVHLRLLFQPKRLPRSRFNFNP